MEKWAGVQLASEQATELEEEQRAASQIEQRQCALLMRMHEIESQETKQNLKVNTDYRTDIQYRQKVMGTAIKNYIFFIQATISATHVFPNASYLCIYDLLQVSYLSILITHH